MPEMLCYEYMFVHVLGFTLYWHFSMLNTHSIFQFTLRSSLMACVTQIFAWENLPKNFSYLK